jgi:hypothetical protein
VGFFNFEKGWPLDDILESLGAEHIAFRTEINGRDIFECSCNYTAKKNNPIVKACPKCGTKYIYEVSDTYEFEEILLKSIPVVLQDDEEFFIFGIKQLTCDLNGGALMSYGENDEAEWLLYVYDKKTKRFEIVETSISMDYFKPWHGELDYGTYETSVVNNGETYGLASALDIQRNYVNADFYVDGNECKINGFIDVKNLIREKLGVDTKTAYSNETLYDLINETYGRINLGFYGELCRNSNLMRNIIQSPYTIGKCRCLYREMLENGMNPQAKTIKEAFGLEPVDINYMDITRLVEKKNYLDKLREEGIEEYEKNVLEKASLSSREEIRKFVAMVAEHFDAPLYEVLKRVSGWLDSGITMMDIVTVKEILNSEFKDIATLSNFTSTQLKKKYSCLKEGILDRETFEAIVKKPTMDNFCKLVSLEEK